jgi:hypothetical protein
MYLGIQYASSGSVLLSGISHLLSSSTLSTSSCVLSSSGHSIKCTSLSRLPQLGHCSSGNASLEYKPTFTLCHKSPRIVWNTKLYTYLAYLPWQGQDVPNPLRQSVHWAICFLDGSVDSFSPFLCLHETKVVLIFCP